MLARIVTAVCLALGLVALVQAQATSPATPVMPAPVSAPALTPEPTSGPYRLQVDDIIRIDLGRINSTTVYVPTDLLVDPSGDIQAPFIGTVHAEGKTFAELFEYLQNQYTTRLAMQPGELKLSLIPVKLHQLRATILGAVVHAGNFDLKRGDRVSTLIGNAQGAIMDGSADLHRATLRRASTNEVIPLDVYDLLTKGDTTQDYRLEDGDVVTIPVETRNKIVVEGEVKQPIVIPYTEGISVSEAITRAGGRTNLSRMTKVTIIRLRPGRPDDPDYLTVNLVSFYKGIDRSQNAQLKPGDTIFVPSNGNPDLTTLNGYFNILYLFRTLGFNPFSF